MQYRPNTRPKAGSGLMTSVILALEEGIPFLLWKVNPY